MAFKDAATAQAYDKRYRATHQKEIAAQGIRYRTTHKAQKAAYDAAFYADPVRKARQMAQMEHYRHTQVEKRANRPRPSVCDACGQPPKHYALHFDHDHRCCPGIASTSCGQCFRGWLCADCNKTLGMVQDDPARLQALIDYLKRAP